MADLSTIARPYARAVFEMAQGSSSLADWSAMLNTLSIIADDSNMQAFVSNPKITPEQAGEMVVDVAGSALNDAGKNLVHLLAENRRLAALPDITVQFEMLKSEAEGTVDVEVTSVEPLTDEHKEKLAASLRTKLGRDVRMSFAQDATLLGGALIKAGDLIIDGTVRGRLDKMAGALADK